MPIILPPVLDPTDVVLQGEQMRIADVVVRDWADAGNVGGVLWPFTPDTHAQPMQDNLIEPDEDAVFPMMTLAETGRRMGGRRAKEPIASGGGICSPMGAWIPTLSDGALLTRLSTGGHVQYYLSGTTRDSSGAALGTCVLKIFRSQDDTLMQQLTSAADGTWSVQVSEVGPFYYVAYKVGVPDRAGTSLNTNLPVASF